MLLRNDEKSTHSDVTIKLLTKYADFCSHLFICLYFSVVCKTVVKRVHVKVIVQRKTPYVKREWFVRTGYVLLLLRASREMSKSPFHSLLYMLC